MDMTQIRTIPAGTKVRATQEGDTEVIYGTVRTHYVNIMGYVIYTITRDDGTPHSVSAVRINWVEDNPELNFTVWINDLD